eukprot:gene1672-2015_t
MSYSRYNLSQECDDLDVAGCDLLPEQYNDSCYRWQINTTNDPQPCQPLHCCTDGSVESKALQQQCEEQNMVCSEVVPEMMTCIPRARCGV